MNSVINKDFFKQVETEFYEHWDKVYLCESKTFRPLWKDYKTRIEILSIAEQFIKGNPDVRLNPDAYCQQINNEALFVSGNMIRRDRKQLREVFLIYCINFHQWK